MRCVFRLAIFLTVAFCLQSAALVPHDRHVVAFYNVENLFDTINDPRTADEDMLPLADREWNTAKYRAKLAGLARVIADMSGSGGFPAVVGIAEAETRGVLEDLAAQPAVAAAGYAVCHYDSPDPRGADVGLLYRPDIFAVEGSRPYCAACDADIRTRDHLAVWGRMCGERIFFLVVHWPSRRGGVEFTAPLREACARRVRAIVDSVRLADAEMRVVVMGDMNDNPFDRSVAEVLGATWRESRLRAGDLYNPFLAVKRSGRGSTVYDRRRNLYDNIVVSDNLVRCPAGSLRLCRADGSKRKGFVFVRDYMLVRRGEPRPTFRGTEYAGGPSDHLPVYVILGH